MNIIIIYGEMLKRAQVPADNELAASEFSDEMANVQ